MSDEILAERRMPNSAVLAHRVDSLEKIATETNQAILSIAASIARLATIEEKIDERHIESKEAFERAFEQIVKIEQRIETKCSEKDAEMKLVHSEMAQWKLMKPQLEFCVKEMPETVKVRDWLVKGAMGVIGIVFIALLALVVHLK